MTGRTKGGSTVRHPIFARCYRRMGAALERNGAAEHRDRLLQGVTGRAVEVGAGSGLNFAHYPVTATEVIAVEPEPYLHERAKEAARDAPVPIRVVDGTADALPFEDASFDVAVASLVLCSVADQAGALAEIRRVLVPGGELRFFEHVLADDPKWARLQHRAAPWWVRLGGGCHPDRDTEHAIAAAGFEIEESDHFLFMPASLGKITAPHILGRARKTAT